MGEMKINNKIVAIIMYAIIFAVYNLIIFLLVIDRNNIFWINYIIFCVFYVFFVFNSIFLLSFKKARVRFFGISLFSFSIYFLFAELFLSTVFIVFRNSVNYKMVVILQAILLCIFVIIYAISIMSMNYSSTISQKCAKSVVDMRTMSFDVSNLVNICTDEKCKNKLRELYDVLKYSDPISTDVVSELNLDIKNNIHELQSKFNNKSQEDLISYIDNIIRMVKIRNEKLKITKI